MTKTGFDFQTLAGNVPPIMSLDHLETFLGGVISTKQREKSIMVSGVSINGKKQANAFTNKESN
jgi:hypothetical protein